MPKLKNHVTKSNEKRVYELKGAKLKGYEYTKKYYVMENGIPKEIEEGDDSALTLISIKKHDDNINKDDNKRAFIFTEGYVGADKAYNEDGTKKSSMAKKSAFGMSFLINYIENASENNINDFHVMFLSDKEKSENQAELFAQAIQDIGNEENVSSINMWCHSKGGLLALRAFQKLKDKHTPETEKILNEKIHAVLTSMPVNGLSDIDR